MSGHSKWATTKRHKAVIDSKRGKIFSMLGKELTIVARESGGNSEFNARLRMLINKAKNANMPNDNIDRAIKKGTGELDGSTIEELVYEGYTPGGVGIMIEVTTDNKNRAASEVRSTLTKLGGTLAGVGALAFYFHRKGQFLFDAEKVTEDALIEVALDNGAEDVKNHGDHFEVLCAIKDFYSLVKAFEEKGMVSDASELAYVPNSLVSVKDADTLQKIHKLVEKLEELEDVKNVFTNLEPEAE